MAQKEKKQEKQTEIILPVCGKTFKLGDVSQATGRMLVKARQMTDTSMALYWIIAQISTIDDEKFTVDDLLDLQAEDLTTVEEAYIQAKENLRLALRT